MKLNFLLLFLFIPAIFATQTTSEIEEKITNEGKQQEILIAKFKELLSEKVEQGDKAAITLTAEAKKNAGNLKLSFAEMKTMMLDWDKSLTKEFKKLPTKAEKTQVVKERFVELLKKKVAAKDEEATKLTKQGLLNGNIRLTIKQMEAFIAKWQ